LFTIYGWVELRTCVEPVETIASDVVGTRQFQPSPLRVEVFQGPVHLTRIHDIKVKGKVFPYSLPSVGPEADPGVQAVSPLVT